MWNTTNTHNDAGVHRETKSTERQFTHNSNLDRSNLVTEVARTDDFIKRVELTNQ